MPVGKLPGAGPIMGDMAVPIMMGGICIGCIWPHAPGIPGPIMSTKCAERHEALTDWAEPRLRMMHVPPDLAGFVRSFVYHLPRSKHPVPGLMIFGGLYPSRKFKSPWRTPPTNTARLPL
jgi:hypothetical protein